MNRKTRAAGLALLAGSIISSTDAKAQQPYPQQPLPRQFIVTEQKTVIVPYTTWQEQREWSKKTQYRQEIIQQPVIYRRVDDECCIARGIGEFVEGVLSFPGQFLTDLTEPCRRPPLQPRVEYVPRYIAPPPNPCGACR